MLADLSRLNSKATWTLGLLFLAIGCGPDATAPSDLGPISLSVVSGNGQSGVVGTELTQPLVIKATDSKGIVGRSHGQLSCDERRRKHVRGDRGHGQQGDCRRLLDAGDLDRPDTESRGAG